MYENGTIRAPSASNPASSSASLHRSQVVAAHDAHRPANAFVRRRFHGDLVDDLAVQIDGLSCVGLPDGTEHGLVSLARVRIRALRGGQAVDDQVHLTQPGRNQFDGLLLDLVRIGIPVDIGRDQSVFRRVPVVSRGVIESRRTASGTAALAFEKNAHRAGVVHRACRDARRQAVSRRSPDHQYTERSGAVLLDGTGDLYLGVDVRSAAGGMRRSTDKAPDARFDDGRGHRFFSLPALKCLLNGYRRRAPAVKGHGFPVPAGCRMGPDPVEIPADVFQDVGV